MPRAAVIVGVLLLGMAAVVLWAVMQDSDSDTPTPKPTPDITVGPVWPSTPPDITVGPVK
jgi:hypothetical protein